MFCHVFFACHSFLGKVDSSILQYLLLLAAPLKSPLEKKIGSGTNIEDLLQNAGLAIAAIDQECTDEHILDIYQHLEKWELVSVHLGLKRADITAIKQDAANDTELMRLYALQKWKSVSIIGGTDTFRVLLKAL